jgi:signal transduction histidine kinase
VLGDLRGEGPWHLGLIGSLREFLDRYAARTGLGVSLASDGHWPMQVRAAAAKHVQRIVREAVYDAHLHHGARCISVSLTLEADLAYVSVWDDGSRLDGESVGPAWGCSAWASGRSSSVARSPSRRCRTRGRWCASSFPGPA